MSKWMSLKEAMEYAGVGRNTILRAVDAKTLRFGRIATTTGNKAKREHLRFKAEWIDDWLSPAA